MTTSLKRAGTVLLSVLLLCTLALSAGAASKLRVGVKFWKTGSDKESMANSGIDTSREASRTRQSNGTYTLTLPIQQVSKMGVTGYLTGLTIGDVTYNGTVTGDVTKDTGVLTIKNLPASVLTGSDVNKALTVTCNIQMDLSLLARSTPLPGCASGISKASPHMHNAVPAVGTALFLVQLSMCFSTKSPTMRSSCSTAFSAPFITLRVVRRSCRWFWVAAITPTAPSAAPAAMPSSIPDAP